MKRTRNFATVVYPESAPEDWQEILSQQHIPCFISPLHDRDINPGGEPKKPHYHVLLMFENVKTLEQAKAIFDQIGGVGMETCNSIRGYARYLCHLDNPDKAQYLQSDVIALGGADYYSIISLASSKYAAIAEMMDYCDDNQVYSYAVLARYARRYREDWYRVLCDNGSIVMKEYVKSCYWDLKEANKEIGL